jgi:hypothetical protein
MYVGRAGGTGKSRLINALKAFFDRRNQPRRYKSHPVLLLQLKNISGMTLHTALLLNQRTSIQSSANTRRDLLRYEKELRVPSVIEIKH